jgi:hypothetical protein
MGWIEQHLHRGQRNPGKAPERQYADAAEQRWERLGKELQADVDEFNSHQSGANFSHPSANQFTVRSSLSGLELTITADFKNRTISYAYSAINDKSKGTPEGGIVSMRQCKNGTVEFYSADEQLTSEQTREILLEPVLFPPELAA